MKNKNFKILGLILSQVFCLFLIPSLALKVEINELTIYYSTILPEYEINVYAVNNETLPKKVNDFVIEPCMGISIPFKISFNQTKLTINGNEIKINWVYDKYSIPYKQFPDVFPAFTIDTNCYKLLQQEKNQTNITIIEKKKNPNFNIYILIIVSIIIVVLSIIAYLLFFKSF